MPEIYFYSVVPDSQFYTDLEQIRTSLCYSHEWGIAGINLEYIVRGIENTIAKGYKIQAPVAGGDATTNSAQPPKKQECYQDLERKERPKGHPVPPEPKYRFVKEKDAPDRIYYFTEKWNVEQNRWVFVTNSLSDKESEGRKRFDSISSEFKQTKEVLEER